MDAIKKLDAKARFIIWAVITFGLWLVANLLLWRVYWPIEGRDPTIALISLTVDIAVGFLTVYALTWAAGEFATSNVQPKIRLQGGSGEKDATGDSDFSAAFRLSLENTTPKAGRHIHLVIRIPTMPSLRACSFNSVHAKDLWLFGEKSSGAGGFCVRVPFSEHLVVYESPVIVGKLILEWGLLPPSGEFPRSVPISYDIYTLDGVSHGEHTLLIDTDGVNW